MPILPFPLFHLISFPNSKFLAQKKKVGKGLMFATEMQTFCRPLYTHQPLGAFTVKSRNAGKRPDKKYTSSPAPEHVSTLYNFERETVVASEANRTTRLDIVQKAMTKGGQFSLGDVNSSIVSLRTR